jgi:hypothetical protein
MANYFSSDQTFLELCGFVLQELHEPSTGSEAVPMDLVEDKINAVYAEVFNDQGIKPSAREADISFALSDDTTLDGAVAVGATSIVLRDATNWKTSGKVLLQGDIITYTGKTTNTLTGVTGVNVTHQDGETARQMYSLATLASDIQAEQIQYIDINGIPQTYMGWENIVNGIDFFPNSYSVFEGYLLFSRNGTSSGSSASKVFMAYTQSLTPLSADGDKPTLIPNSWRQPLLGYGACMKIAGADAYRTAWDFWKSGHDEAKAQYIAFKNTRVRDRVNKIRPSLYSRLLV